MVVVVVERESVFLLYAERGRSVFFVVSVRTLDMRERRRCFQII